jgi:hypothetical protein
MPENDENSGITYGPDGSVTISAPVAVGEFTITPDEAPTNTEES